MSQKKCESCSGTGFVPQSWGLGDNVKCPTCKGSGFVPVASNERGAFVLPDPGAGKIAEDEFYRKVRNAVGR